MGDTIISPELFSNLMEKKLYVGNLPYETTDADLKELFSQAGNVSSASVIIHKATGRSKGFGFVEMSTEEEAKKAIDTFNGSDVGGRKITVDEARPMRPRSERGRFNRREF